MGFQVTQSDRPASGQFGSELDSGVMDQLRSAARRGFRPPIGPGPKIERATHVGARVHLPRASQGQTSTFSERGHPHEKSANRSPRRGLAAPRVPRVQDKNARGCRERCVYALQWRAAKDFVATSRHRPDTSCQSRQSCMRHVVALPYHHCGHPPGMQRSLARKKHGQCGDVQNKTTE